MTDDDIFCGECGQVSRVASEGFGSRDTLVLEPVAPAIMGAAEAEPEPGIRFVLQFSTGESVTVFGSGLIGRSPRPEPGEYYEQLVRMFDPSRSVSKTHLEFGQDDGTFWVLDRYSGNGTVLKEPDTEAVRCVPDRRYHLQRGTRVEIGEQFFIVS
ncbi:hypothetical protein BH09ACT3_BH09ACT3_10010 [soil metagenome]